MRRNPTQRKHTEKQNFERTVKTNKVIENQGKFLIENL